VVRRGQEVVLPSKRAPSMSSKKKKGEGKEASVRDWAHKNAERFRYRLERERKKARRENGTFLVPEESNRKKKRKAGKNPCPFLSRGEKGGFTYAPLPGKKTSNEADRLISKEREKKSKRTLEGGGAGQRLNPPCSGGKGRGRGRQKEGLLRAKGTRPLSRRGRRVFFHKRRKRKRQ